MLKPFADCQHERLDGDVTGSAFDDHRTTRGLCPDCGQYIVVTDYASNLSTARLMTKAEREAWYKAECQDICCTQCETDFGAIEGGECGGDPCQRAPGSDICLTCARRNDNEAHYRGLYNAGALDDCRPIDDEQYRADMVDAGRGSLLR